MPLTHKENTLLFLQSIAITAVNAQRSLEADHLDEVGDALWDIEDDIARARDALSDLQMSKPEI